MTKHVLMQNNKIIKEKPPRKQVSFILCPIWSVVYSVEVFSELIKKIKSEHDNLLSSESQFFKLKILLNVRLHDRIQRSCKHTLNNIYDLEISCN